MPTEAGNRNNIDFSSYLCPEDSVNEEAFGSFGLFSQYAKLVTLLELVLRD